MATAWHYQEEKKTKHRKCTSLLSIPVARHLVHDPIIWCSNFLFTHGFWGLASRSTQNCCHCCYFASCLLHQIAITAFLRHTGFGFLILWFGAWAQSEYSEYRNSFGNQWRYPSPFPNYANILERFTFLLLTIFQVSPPVWTRSWFGISVEES